MNCHVENFLKIIKYAIHESKDDTLPELIQFVDWARMSNMAKAHNLFALFHEVAYKYPSYQSCAEYERNTQTALTIIAQQLKKTESFLQLYREFLDNNLHPIVMKGIVCRQLYGKYGEHRPSGDEDILVKKDEFYKVKTVMEAHGYVCEQPDVTKLQLDTLQEVSFYESRSRFLIEVHTNIMGNENEMRTQMGECFRDVFEHMHVFEICDLPIATMSHTEHLLFLVLHAFKHFTLTGVGLRQMLDILLFQERYEEEIDWKYVEESLKKNHAIEYFGDLQFIGMQYLGFDLHVRFQTRDPESLLEDMIEVGVFGKKEEADVLAARINLSTNETKGRGIFILMRAGFPSISYMRNSAPYLDEKPWLLPFEWIKRWVRFVKRSKAYNGNLMLVGLQKSKKRKELLKKYGI